jgi:hypothetical protein
MNKLRSIATSAILATLLTACAGARSFYHQAPPGQTHVTPVQMAKKVLQHANVTGVEIVALRADPSVSGPAKAVLLEGYRKTVCSDIERAESTPTANCRQGPQWQAGKTIAAYETLKSAQNEADMQAASDALFQQLGELIDLIAKTR